MRFIYTSISVAMLSLCLSFLLNIANAEDSKSINFDSLSEYWKIDNSAFEPDPELLQEMVNGLPDSGEATITIRFLVSPEGEVGNIQVIEASHDQLLKPYAMERINAMELKPLAREANPPKLEVTFEESFIQP